MQQGQKRAQHHDLTTIQQMWVSGALPREVGYHHLTGEQDDWCAIFARVTESFLSWTVPTLFLGRKSLVAATLAPPNATNSANIATAIAGLGRRSFNMIPPFGR